MPSFAPAMIRTVDARQRLGNIPLNAVLTETHSIINTVTRAPVDGEADRARHIITQPREVAITAIVSASSDSPEDQAIGHFVRRPVVVINRPSIGFGEISVERPSIGEELGLEIDQPPGETAFERHASFWARLNALNDSKELFDYVSDLGVYENMVFDSVEVVRDDREWIEFSALLVEFVMTGVTRDRWLSEDQADDSRDPADPGTKTPKESAVDQPLPDVTEGRLLQDVTVS